jgi:hypothetical protein
MTFIAAFRCKGGIVLFADSQETTGDYKLIVEKLTPREAGNYTIALGACGIGDLADSMLDRLIDSVSAWDTTSPKELKELLRTEVQTFHSTDVATYPSGGKSKRIKAVLCIKHKDSDFPLLFDIAGSTVKEAGPYSLISWDIPVLNHFVQRLYRQDMTISRAILLGLHLFGIVHGISATVGGETKLLVAHKKGIWSEDPRYVRESADRISIFTNAVDELLFTCCDLATSTPDFVGALEEFRLSALQLRQEFLQSATEILYPTADAALSDASPIPHFPPASCFVIKGDGTVKYGEENAKELARLKSLIALANEDIKKIQEIRKQKTRLVKKVSR